MNLKNFEIADDNIAFIKNDEYYDMHNCYSFISMSYDLSKRKLDFTWMKNSVDCVRQNSPNKIKLLLQGVEMFKVRERDNDLPYTEDDCLSSIGFIWDNMIEEMGSFCSNKPNDNCNHLSLEFMSGLAIKVKANLACLYTDDNVNVNL